MWVKWAPEIITQCQTTSLFLANADSHLCHHMTSINSNELKSEENSLCNTMIISESTHSGFVAFWTNRLNLAYLTILSMLIPPTRGSWLRTSLLIGWHRWRCISTVKYYQVWVHQGGKVSNSLTKKLQVLGNSSILIACFQLSQTPRPYIKCVPCNVSLHMYWK